MSDADQARLLAGRKIAVPESRELNLFAGMLESRGAEVVRCPLVSIYDSPDVERVEGWLREFIAGDCEDIILLTGEGLRRLLGFAERAGGSLQGDFIGKLAVVRKISRGPKPGNALRKIGLKPDLLAAQPTTEGVIETLVPEKLTGRKIAVQLYGSNPNRLLIDFLEGKGARVCTVAPYVYADDSEDSRVAELLEAICQQTLDAIAFTSTPQVTRLFQVAKKQALETSLTEALNNIQVAAVGPVVANALTAKGVDVKIMPESSYFMKPLVRRLTEELNR